ncbi:MAG: type III-A CRISPR-associated RAMP protein Csm3 [Bacteroidota bacterium]
MQSFKANLIIRGKIKCLTGLHIGGSKEKLEIGGVDSIVVRNPGNEYPYIPGSSLKGKMRHLLEYALGGVNKPIFQEEDETVEKAYGRVSRMHEIVRLFGAGASEREVKKNYLEGVGLGRLIIRDAMPDSKTVNTWKKIDSDSLYTEIKAENTIDRITSAANPRFIERVVEGSTFDFEIVYSVYLADSENVERTNKDIQYLLTGLRLLEASALGKSGSRGYGKIQFLLDQPLWVSSKDYIKGEESSRWIAAQQPLSGNLHALADTKLTDYQYTPADEN